VTASLAGRTPKRAAIAALILGIAVSLAACSNSGTGLAQQACSHINRSIALLKESDHPSGQSTAETLQVQAYDQLRAALPIAAEAAYQNGQWQALMTTVSESNRVPETTLVPALKAQCTDADTTIFGQQAPPASIPPAAPTGTTG